MPAYVIINPDAQTITLEDFADYRNALKYAGLKSGEIDFCTIGTYHDLTFSIMLFEFGLINPRQKTYFRLGKQLFNGNAVVFAANIEGETVDFPAAIAEHWIVCPEFEWLLDAAAAAEAAIQSNRVNRPQTTINGKVVWSWTSNSTVH